MPGTISELASVLRSSGRRGEPLLIAEYGPGPAARAAREYTESEALVISTRRLARLVDFDRQAGTVTAEAGIELGVLNDRLGGRGLALDNPGDAGRHTLGEALANGMYGVGGCCRSLASQVVALEVMCADGTSLRCSAGEEPEAFAAARVHLGALGIVTRVTLRTVTGFNVAARHSVEPLGRVVDSMEDEIAASDYFDCRWLPHTDLVAIRRRNRSSAPPGGRGNLAWLGDRSLGQVLAGAEASHLARRWPKLIPRALRMAAVGARDSYCDRSYRVLVDSQPPAWPAVGWAVPLHSLPRALRDLVTWQRSAGSHGARRALLGPVRVRAGVSDDAWMSPAYGRATGFVAVGVAPDDEGARAGDAIAALMAPLGGRPAWGSVHPLGATDLEERYPRWADWQAQRVRLDPQGRFVNPTSLQILGPLH
jgi:FAD/FMN-containing dehydrogenase